MATNEPLTPESLEVLERVLAEYAQHVLGAAGAAARAAAESMASNRGAAVDAAIAHTNTRGILGGAALAPFEASLGPKGWEYDGIKSSSDVTQQRLLDVIRERAESGQPIRTKTEAVEAIPGKRKAKLDAWDELIDSGAIEHIPDGSGYQPRRSERDPA